MALLWVVVADGSRARIFSAESPAGALAEEASFVATDVRLRQSELKTDRPGASFASVGHGRHAMATEVAPREHERIRFAKMIADRLEAGRIANAFERLALVASPAFLGLLREHLGAPARVHARQGLRDTVPGRDPGAAAGAALKPAGTTAPLRYGHGACPLKGPPERRFNR
jgi:protein required for attachment to host cells